MAKEAAGILLFRTRGYGLEVFLAHPGGPFWAKKDAGAWSIPKGEIEPGEDAQAAALRELREETGFVADGTLVALTPIKQKSGKLVRAWAIEADYDPARLRSNTFRMEWPPRSGRMQDFPEVDRVAWFTLDAARVKINPAQAALIDELAAIVDATRERPASR